MPSRLLTRERRLVLAIAVIAVVVHLPALGAPLMLDDYAQSAMVGGTFPVSRSPLDMYDFVDDGSRALLVDRGVLPWWAHPRLTVRFMRPVSSALLWVDYRLFARKPFGPHLHSLLWWAVASAAAYALFKRTLGPRVALLGGAAFAFAPCHAIPLVWLANREALVSTALGALAIAAYSRWREARRARDALASGALFAVALLGGEYTLCFGGYVLAIELVRRDESPARRATGALPLALPAAAYLAARGALGYGAYGSGFYRDPLAQVGPFLDGAPRRLVVLLSDGWLTLDADAWWASASAWKLAAIAIAGVAALWVPVGRSIRALDPDRRARAQWLFLGSLFALVPLMAVQPSSRLIGASMIGASATVGVLLEHAWFPAESADRTGAAKLAALVAIALGFAHFVRAPVLTWLYMRIACGIEAGYEERIAWVHDHVPDHDSKRIVVVRADAAQTMLFAPFMIDRERGVPPERWWVLSYASGPSLMLRTGPRSVDLVVDAQKTLFPIGIADLFRNEDAPVRVGERVEMQGMTASVVDADENGTHRVRFEFDRDLEDPTLVWIAEGFKGFREERPPEVGYGWPVGP